MDRETYIDATKESGLHLVKWDKPGPIIMLNLLKFKDVADYSQFPKLAPASSVTGERAYHNYMAAVRPLLESAGAEVLYKGSGGPFAIGPQDEVWDLVLLVKHKSIQVFMEFAVSEDYQKIAGHRTAALADSRLLPSVAI